MRHLLFLHCVVCYTDYCLEVTVNFCSIPDTAAEPEPEYHEFTEPRIIPLLDVCYLLCMSLIDVSIYIIIIAMAAVIKLNEIWFHIQLESRHCLSLLWK